MPVWAPSAWWLLLAAAPVLLLGEFLLASIRPLAKFDLPAPIVGGLVVAAAALLINVSGLAKLSIANKVTARPWNWIITPEPLLKKSPATPIYLPLSSAFFCCVGLNASWAVAKKGSWQLLLMLGLATLLGVLQNILGVSMCRWMHLNPLLGLICGSVTLTGGPSTALGLADTFERAGFPAAAVVGAAAAMFGIVTASLLAGAVGGQLIRRLRLKPTAPVTTSTSPRARKNIGFLSRLQSAIANGPSTIGHLLILLVCMKLGSWVSFGFSRMNLNPPVYMGGMLLAILYRNLTDQGKRFRINPETVHTIASISLGLFLAMAMASLNLLDLRTLAIPMLAILGAQIMLMLLFAIGVTYIIMGRDYDAAIMAAGHVGFGLGITPNTVATMDALEEKFGPSPRAVLIITLVGAFLIDITNFIIITAHLKYLHH